MKQSARGDKGNCFEKRAAAAEEAAENGRNKELYNIITSITVEMRKQEVGVKDKQGGLGPKTRERMQR